MLIIRIAKAICISSLFFACTGDAPVPKPKAYPRLEFAQKQYALQNNGHYTYKLPQYYLVKKDTLNNGMTPAGWYNLTAKPYNATLHLTYHHLASAQELDSLIQDTRKLVNKQIDKATDIEEIPMENYSPSNNGIYFNILGYTATNLNFYITDSKKHFLRGALYFNYAAPPDSVQPIYQFLKQDVDSLLTSLTWKN